MPDRYGEPTETATAYMVPMAGSGATLAIGWVPLGSSSTTVCVGNDTRLSDARIPTAHATSHKNGGADEVATATAAANAIPKAGAGATLAKEWFPQGTAIADATGGGVIDAEARTALNALLARLRAGTVWLAT